MTENILQSLQSIWSHKLRSFLTMLGVIIGIAAIITIVATIRGTNDQIKENLVGSGTNAVEIRITSENSYYEPGWSQTPDGITPVTEETREALLDLDGVTDATVYHRMEYVQGVSRLKTSFNGNLIGADDHYFNVFSYAVVHGRSFAESDHRLCRKVAVLDMDAVRCLFPDEDPLGLTIEILGEPFTVIGIVDRSSDFEPVIENMQDYYTYIGDANSAGSVFIPDSTWPMAFSFDMPDFVAVKAASTDAMTNAGTAAAEYLTEAHTQGSDFTYESTDVLELAARIQALSKSANSQLIWIAGISLLVGGIGVMNIMLVSVTERTREIGLRKAIGAKRRRILLQFLTEAAVLTSMGGILGVLAGLGLAQVFTGVMGIPAKVSPESALIAVAFSMFIGILFGLIPAVKASKLNPIEALRRE